MSKTHFKFLVAVHAFFIRDNKVLLLERANTGYADGQFSVPAGHVDGGEKIAEAISREVREEIGITLGHDLQPAHIMHRTVSPAEERIDFFYVISDWQGEPSNGEPEKCAQLIWADMDNLPKNMVPYVRFALEQVRNDLNFSEFSV